LLVGGPRLAGIDLEVGVTAQQFALGCAGFELRGENSNRNAGGAIDAAWPVGDGLAAAEPDPAQRFIQFARMAAGEFGENLPLDLARKIRTRARVRHEKLREAERCAHPRPRSNGYTAVYATGKRRRKGFGRVKFDGIPSLSRQETGKCHPATRNQSS